jgi:hypothetical protein
VSVKRRLNFFSGARLDVSHVKSIESSVAYDFDSFIRGMVTGLNKPYLIRGFRIKIPQNAIAATNLEIEVSDSAILHSTASESGTILTVPAGTANDILDSSNNKVIGSFQSGVANYVSLDYRRVTDTSTIDAMSGWSASQKLEYQRSTAIGKVLEYRYIISPIGFSTYLPLYIVYTDVNGKVSSITKATQNLFRLGSGGANPDPANSFNWGNLTNTQTLDGRKEWTSDVVGANPVSVTPGKDVQAFDYGDFAIKNLKDWMDSIMTRLKEITGSNYWYTNSVAGSGSPTINSVWWDSVGSVLTGSGAISYNLVLETTTPTDGNYQSSFTDSTVLSGDAYVEGATSGVKATVTSFNNNSTLINSLTSAGFVYSESLRFRRKFRPSSASWLLIDEPHNTARLGTLQRKSSSTTAGNINSWSYENVTNSVSDFSFSLISINVSNIANFAPGQFIKVSGISAADDSATGTHRILKIQGNVLTYAVNKQQSGVATVSGTNGVDLTDQTVRHPFTSPLEITNATMDATPGFAVLTIPRNTFKAPVTGTTVFVGGANYIAVTSGNISSFENGMKITDANITGGYAYILDINVATNTLFISSTIVALPSGTSFIAKQVVLLSDLVVIGAPNREASGIKTIESIGVSEDITVDLGYPAITQINTGGYAEIAFHKVITTVTGAISNTYNTTNQAIFCIAGDKAQYTVGQDSALPELFSASGDICFDTVVAETTVANPNRIVSIQKLSATEVKVTTTVDHGLVSNPSTTVVIHGDSNLSPFIKAYKLVTLTYIDATSFKLTSTTEIPSGTDFTNTGIQNVFLNFDNNPYAGPVQWTGDMVVKSVVGDLAITIPQTATVDTTGSSPEANKFNTSGVTGTAFLEDGEVAFVKLERNQPISNGVVYSTLGGSATIAGNFLDISGNLLEVGDFVKFANEEDSHWLKIGSISTSSMILVGNDGQAPSTVHRPANTGAMVYTKGVYSDVFVTKHYLVENSSDIYWFALRRDNNNSAKVYFRSLEMEPGEVRQVNDNQGSNHLVYTGAMTESAVNPNYSIADASGSYIYKSQVEVIALDAKTQMITLSASNLLGYQTGDKLEFIDLSGNHHYYTVKFPLSSITVIVDQNISALSVSDTLAYYQVNQHIEDQDNLTLAHRKQDRNVGSINTALKRPVYDESVYIQKMDFTPNFGGDIIRSGSYIYQGSIESPTSLAWVLHGSADVTETIESASIVMPGGLQGSNSIVINIVNGTFADGTSIYQNGNMVGTVNNPGDGPFAGVSLYGDPAPLGDTGTELVLPPNKRTEVLSAGGIGTYGAHSVYKQTTELSLTGEELLVIVNDGIREAGYDYVETFGGPKAKIRLKRTLPPNTRLRFRAMASYGSVLAAKSADISLQAAYNTGADIQTSPGRPVNITASNVNGGETSFINRGSIAIAGGTSALGGIFNESTDQSFVIGRENNKPKEVWTGVEKLKTHSSHPDSAVTRKTAAQVVVGATGTIISGSEVTLSDNYSYRIKVNAVARRSDGPLGVSSFALEGTFYRSGGTAQAAGSPISNINGYDGDGSDYAITFALSGNDVVAVVYGTSGATIQWAISVEYQPVGVA